MTLWEGDARYNRGRLPVYKVGYKKGIIELLRGEFVKPLLMKAQPHCPILSQKASDPWRHRPQ